MKTDNRRAIENLHDEVKLLQQRLAQVEILGE
jgi:hypothetical protein